MVLNHLYRHGEAATAEPRNPLGVVDDNNELIKGCMHHLLVEESAAMALNEVEVSADVNGEIEAEVGVEEGEGDTNLDIA